MNEYISARQAADALGVSTRTIQRAVRSGALIGVQIGGTLVIEARSLVGYKLRKAALRPRSKE